ncbi:hypothetical protein BGZ60DRAFT_431697 [Tricladium varicosporioides]|nr:hypothetical protein BGZ60DRAFT_431697 [Hymenoscyphus varicosporioides]
MKPTVFLSIFAATATAVALTNDSPRSTTTTCPPSLIPTYTSPNVEAASAVKEPVIVITNGSINLEEKKGGRVGGGGGKGGGKGGNGGGTVVAANPASDGTGLSPESPILILASLSYLICSIL